MSGIKGDLHAKLRASRANVVARLDGLGEYDIRRPMTPSGTNLLGLDAPEPPVAAVSVFRW